MRDVCSLYAQCESCVCILNIKSDLFQVSVGFRQGCALSPLLFVILMDRVSMRSRSQEGVVWGSLRVSLLLFADDVVLLAPSHECLQHALKQFAAECDAVSMRISTSKSESMVLSQKRIECPLQVEEENLPQVKEFKYLGVFFMRDGRRDGEFSRRLGQAAAVMQLLYRTVVVKRELSHKAKLSIFRAVYMPTLTFGHELLIRHNPA